MTFLDVLYSLFLYITLNLPTFDISQQDIGIASITMVWLSGFSYALVCEFTAPKPKFVKASLPAAPVPVTWEKVARARIKSVSDLWFAVTCCIDNHYGEAIGDEWRQFNKIRIDRSSNGEYRAVSHGMVIYLPDWHWAE